MKQNFEEFKQTDVYKNVASEKLAKRESAAITAKSTLKFIVKWFVIIMLICSVVGGIIFYSIYHVNHDSAKIDDNYQERVVALFDAVDVYSKAHPLTWEYVTTEDPTYKTLDESSKKAWREEFDKTKAEIDKKGLTWYNAVKTYQYGSALADARGLAIETAYNDKDKLVNKHLKSPLAGESDVALISSYRLPDRFVNALLKGERYGLYYAIYTLDGEKRFNGSKKSWEKSDENDLKRFKEASK